MASCASGQCSIFVSNDDTSNFICTSPSDTSLEAKWYQDFHQIFSHRHFYWTKWDTLFVKKIVFCRFLSVLLRIISIFYVHSLFHPLECWKTQKTASNLVSYFLCTEAKVQNHANAISKKTDFNVLCIDENGQIVGDGNETGSLHIDFEFR